MNLSIKISSNLFYLIPLTLLTGPFLPDLFLSLIAIIFLFNVIIFKQYEYLNNKFFIIFILFYLYLILNSVISDYSNISFRSSLFYLRFGIFSCATWFLINHNPNFTKYFFWILLFTFFLAIIDGFYQYFSNISIFGIINDVPNRLTLTFNDKLILGGYLSRIFPLLIGLILILIKNKNQKYFLISILFISIDVLVFISGERSALGLMMLLSIFLILFMTKYRLLRICTILISIILIVIISIQNPSTKSRTIDHTISQMGLADENNEVKTFSVIHDSLFMTAYRSFIDKPIIGHGPNTFRETCKLEKFKVGKYNCSTHPHNTYLQLLSEIGIIGFLPILIIFYYLGNTLLRQLIFNLKRKDAYYTDFQICIIGCLVLTLWPFIPTQNFFNNWISVIYYLPIGFLLHSLHSK